MKQDFRLEPRREQHSEEGGSAAVPLVARAVVNNGNGGSGGEANGDKTGLTSV